MSEPSASGSPWGCRDGGARQVRILYPYSYRSLQYRGSNDPTTNLVADCSKDSRRWGATGETGPLWPVSFYSDIFDARVPDDERAQVLLKLLSRQEVALELRGVQMQGIK